MSWVGCDAPDGFWYEFYLKVDRLSPSDSCYVLTIRCPKFPLDPGQQIDPILCLPGTYCVNNTNYPANCPQGYYCPTPSEKILCPDGHYCRGFDVSPVACSGWSLCPKGTAWPTSLSEGVAGLAVGLLLFIMNKFVYARRFPTSKEGGITF